MLRDSKSTSITAEQRQQQRRSIRHLHDAISHDDVSQVRRLTTPTSGSGQLDYDVDQALHGLTALQVACTRRSSADLCRCLVAAGADVDRTDPGSGDTSLHSAARTGHAEVVRALLDAGANTEVTDSTGTTALGLAAKAGENEVVKILLAAGCGLNRGDVAGSSPLISAVRQGHVDTVNLLVAHPEVDLEWTDNERRTALIVAAQHNRLRVLHILVDAGSKLDARDQYGCTALYFAAKHGHPDVVRHLISAGAGLNIADTKGCSPLSMAVESVELDIVKQLIDAGSDVNVVETNHHFTAVHRAVRYSSEVFGQRDDHLSLFQLLLSANCDVNIPDKLGWTPLHTAASTGEIGMVRQLLDQGADISRVTDNRDTVLHRAVASNKPTITQMLIAAGCDVNRVNSKNKLPLYTAIESKADSEIVRLLLDAGSKTDICELKTHQSPLFVAVQHQLIEVIRLLITAGCDVNLANSEGNTPLSLACSLGSDVIVELLLKHPKVDVDEGILRAPLHEAAAGGSLVIVERLITAGCNVNKLLMTGVSALFVAADQNHFDVARMLVRHGASPSANHHVRPPALCCRAHRDPHPHLELEPLFAAVQNDNLPMIKLILVATPRMPYSDIQTLRDIVFRTGYAHEARLSDQIVAQYAHFFIGALSRPRSLRLECRGVIRDCLCFGRHHATLGQAAGLLPLPDRLKDYIMLRNESIVGFGNT